MEKIGDNCARAIDNQPHDLMRQASKSGLGGQFTEDR